MRIVEQAGYRIALDPGNQVLKLDIPESQTGDNVLFPALSGYLAQQDFVSASALAMKAKQFDDGLYAAVEILAQRGGDNFAGKSYLLSTLASLISRQELSEGRDPLSLILAACQVGGSPADIPAWIKDEVSGGIKEFLADELASKPVGFYTWSKELTAIFQQDRLLQSELIGKPGIEAIVAALRSDQKLSKTYRQYLALISKLTNPLSKPDLSYLLAEPEPPVPSAGVHFFPPSRSHETDLMEKLFGNKPIPDGFNLLEEMISRIRCGKLDLTPSENSGWYDLQTWALEPLVVPGRMPESANLHLSESYRQYLLALFKSLMALTRETHVKQLEMLTCGGGMPNLPIITIAPELSVEPLAEFYLRRALSYRFVRKILVETFGSRALERVPRLTADGATRSSLDAELSEMEGLFYGAYLTAARQTGIAAQKPSGLGSGKGSEADEAAFAAWLCQMDRDPDLSLDTRMMVPVFFDVARNKTKVWLFAGWSYSELVVSYDREPKIISMERTGTEPALAGAMLAGSRPESCPAEGPQMPVTFTSLCRQLAYPVMAEVYVDRLLNRDEFRAHCDRHKTIKAIIANLQ